MVLDWRCLGVLADMAWEIFITVPWAQWNAGSVQDSSYSSRLAQQCHHCVFPFLVSPSRQLISKIETQTSQISWLFNFWSWWIPICVWPCWFTAPALMHFRINRVDLLHWLVHHPYQCVLWRTWMRRNHQLCSSTQCCVLSTFLAHKLFHYVLIPNVPWLPRLVVLSGQGHFYFG